MFDEQREKLLAALDQAYNTYHRALPFSGPSVHFHLKALEAAREQNLGRFTDYAYAMLAAWGMHRMGPSGSKMCEFEAFKSSLKAVWPLASSLRNKKPAAMTENDWNTLKDVFLRTRCMASGTSLVGNSKVMAHLLPNLVPPVDCQYTLTFLYGHGRITNGIESEWKTLAEILSGFFYPILQSPRFKTRASEWLSSNNQPNRDTSELKIVDNLIIGLLKIPNGVQTPKASTTPAQPSPPIQSVAQ